jgi:hypothetical protein
MPSPLGAVPHPVDPPPTDFRGEHRADPVPPEPHRFMADLDATLVEEVLNVA